MVRIQLLVLALLVLVPGPWAADVSDQIIRLYERVTDLQERVHQLEQTSGNGTEVRQLQARVAELQQRIGGAAGLPATEQTAEWTEVQRRVLDLESQVRLLSAAGGGAGAVSGIADLPARIAINHVWVVLCAVLVMLMQLGFAFVEAGLTRGKNAVHTMTMNLMDYGIGMVAYWAVGFALMFGGVGAIESLGIRAEWLDNLIGIEIGGTTYGLLGASGFFLSGLTSTPVMTFFFFQMVFAATANTICTGTLAERWRIQAFYLASPLMAGIIYPLFGSWAWGGGWLQKIGYLDFAGSTVVHAAGGIIALAGALMIGPRKGKFDATGRPRAIPGHNLPYAFLGTFILAFGWFGFNAGSTLRADGNIGLIAVNTALASATGSLSGLFTTVLLFKRPDPSFACNGMLAGLVAITAGCAFVAPWAAAIIGVVAGVLVVFSAIFVEEKLKVDDPVGAISVHGTNGLWGGLAVGIFAMPSLAGNAGLVYGGTTQMMIQIVGVTACLILFLVTGFVMFRFISLFVKSRASDDEQEEGLDLSEMGVPAYSKD